MGEFSCSVSTSQGMGICMSEEGEAQKRQTALNAGDNKQIAKNGHALPSDDLAPESLLQREYLKSIFITLDSDLNGFIDASELKAFDGLTEQQQKEIFAQMDKQKYRDGRVGLDEFLLFWTAASEQTMSMDDFMTQEDDQREVVLEQELRKGQWFTHATRLFNEIDKNNDNTLDLEEYRRWVAASPDRAKLFIPSFDDSSAESILASAKRSWDAMDLDQDGALTHEEFKTGYLDGMSKSFNCQDNTNRA